MRLRTIAALAAGVAIASTGVVAPALAADDPVLVAEGVVAIAADSSDPNPVRIVAGNTAIPVEAEAVEGIDPGTVVEVEVAIPDETVAELDIAGDVEAETALGAAVAAEATEPLQVESISEVAVAPAEVGVPHYLDIVVNTRGFGSYQPTNAEIFAAVAQASEYFIENTDGEFPGFTIRRLDHYTSSFACGNAHDTFDWATQAAAVYGTTLQPYLTTGSGEHLVLIGECRYDSKAAIGTVGQSLEDGGYIATQSDFFTYTGADAMFGGTIAHEFGHNFSLGHANATKTNGCSFSTRPLFTDLSNCGTYEYADEWSIMGFTTPIPSAPLLDIARRDQLGLTDATSLASHGASATASYALNPLGAPSGLRGVKVTAASGTYYIEYRDGTGEPNAMYLDAGNCLDEWEPSATCPASLNPVPTGPGIRVLKLGSEASTRVSAVRTHAQLGAWAEFGLDPHDWWRSSAGDVAVEFSGVSGGAANITVRTGAVSVSTVQVALSGAPTLGSPVTAVTSGVTPGGAALSYKWFRNGVEIAGATGASYTPVAADAGKTLMVRADAYAAGYVPAQDYESAPVVPGVPTLGGTVRVASPVTAVPGDWPAGFTLSYQWKVSGLDVGATGDTYVPDPWAQGKSLTVRVTGTHPTLGTVSLTSAPVTIGYGVLASSTPKISGTAVVGGTLRAWPGSWTAGTEFTYRWYANGAAISGATGVTYKVPSAMAGKKITVKVTGRLTGYSAKGVTSASVGVPKVATPAIKGTPKVGYWLVASPGTWTTNTTFTYQWYANGYTLVGATGSKYKVTSANVGKVITVKVTGTKTGYTTVTKTSAGTAKVVR